MILHNYLRQDSHSRNIYCPPGMADSVDENGDLIPGSWRQESADSAFLSIENNVGGNNVSNSGKKVRDAFADYFSNEGCVDWQ